MRLTSIGPKIALGFLIAGLFLATPRVWAQPGAAGASLGADESIQEVVDAKGRFVSGDFDGALQFLREAFKKYPDRVPPGQVIIAMWYGEIEQGAASLASLERAILENPDDPQAYLIIANSEIQSGRVTAADMLFKKAQSLLAGFNSPNRKKTLEPAVYAGLAACCEYRGAVSTDDPARAEKEWVAAQGYLEAWLKISPDNSAAMQRLARALFKQKTKEKVNAAYDMLKKVATIDTTVLQPAATMALYYQDENDFEKAKQFMSYALQVAPQDLRTRLVAAQWCLQTSIADPAQLDQAREHATAALQIDGGSMDALVLRGVVALFQKEYESAARYFETAHLQSPGNFAAGNNLALALCEQDEAKKRRALEFAVNNAKQYTNSPEAASTYAWVLYKNGRIADADTVLSRLIATTRVSEDTLYYAARIALDATQPRREEATRYLQRALASKRPFSMRPEALALAEQLSKPR